MKAVAWPCILILFLIGMLALTKPDCEDSMLKTRLTEVAFVAIFVIGAALSASLAKRQRILTVLLLALIVIPLSAAFWIMILWPVWRLGFLWDVYWMTLPTQMLWLVPVMVLTAWVTGLLIGGKGNKPSDISPGLLRKEDHV